MMFAQQQIMARQSAASYRSLGALGALSSADVRTIQAQLNALPSNQARLVVDGVFGPKTKARLLEFQQQYALPPTGEPDSITLQVLSREARNRGFSTTPITGAVTGAGTVIAPIAQRAQVNVGDTVLVIVLATVTNLNTRSSLKSALQARLQQAGFRVLAIDDNALAAWSLSGGQVLVTVQPTTSAYAFPEDVGSIVRGAMEAVGYGSGAFSNPQLVSARVVTQGSSAAASGPIAPGASGPYAAPIASASLSAAIGEILPWALGGIAVLAILSVLKNR
jgi:peptidoglycan hydrolase-like protein with peptidoglycan-binding domain